MSNLTRWEPLKDMRTMRDTMDRRFDPDGEGRMNVPKIDMLENDNDIVVKAELPGFQPEKIDVSVDGNLLSLRGEYAEQHEKQEGQYHIQERRQNSFSRMIPLPTKVNPDAAKAEFNDGVLTISLPKIEASKAKHITVSAKKG
jgi:HSP20 family protein